MPTKLLSAKKDTQLKMKKNSPTRLIIDSPGSKPTHDEIALCAYSIWEQEGRTPSRQVENWLQAETQLRSDRKHDAVRV